MDSSPSKLPKSQSQGHLKSNGGLLEASIASSAHQGTGSRPSTSHGNNNNGSGNNSANHSTSQLLPPKNSSPSASHRNLQPPSSPPNPGMERSESFAQRQVFKKNIVGDLFGTLSGGEQSLAGLMYRSRIVERSDNNISTEEKKEESLQQDSLVSSKEIVDSESDSDNETKLLKSMNPKQQLALTIKNWSVFPDNDEHIIKEGAVYALIALAHLDDSTIRRCCASSFFHLSSRERNREELLTIGTTAGVITLAMQARNWKVAKLCALTLCNLSMQMDGEAIMAKEGAILALVVLLGIKGQSLLPICVQALYNMTCARDHFKGIERIIKALLNMSSAGYDHSEFLVKALVNCSRYSWLRLRIIEDGGVTNLHALLPNLSIHEHKADITFHILTALRSLSESSGCRTEMLQKGSVELIYNLLTDSISATMNATAATNTNGTNAISSLHLNNMASIAVNASIDEKGLLLIMKIMHNFLQAPLSLSINAFELSIHIVFLILQTTRIVATIQYCAACYHIFTREKLRGLNHLAYSVIQAMSILLKSDDAITQFFAISCSGNVFFHHLCHDGPQLDQLITFFVRHGSNITDPAAKQALALALAKLSQEVNYLDVIDKLGLMEQVLVLLINLRETHKDSLLLQESCCIAICRLSLRMRLMLNEDYRLKIAGIFLDMLHTTDNLFVLTSTISGIRALGSSGLCPRELLNHPEFTKCPKNLLAQVASTIHQFVTDLALCRVGCAVLAVFSYDVSTHDSLAHRDILDVLFTNINSDDDTTRELVANTLCNLSTHAQACQEMITMNVVETLGKLSSSTSEVILELSAKCICNLTCHTDVHQAMLSNHVLEILLMISLVRTVSNNTKYICAKALLNLIQDGNIPAISQSNAVRIFATLSTTPYLPLQKTCSKGFHVLSLNVTRRKELVKHRSVLQALFQMLKSSSSYSPATSGGLQPQPTASSTHSKIAIRLGTTLINLLACPVTNSEVIHAGGLTCLKMMATMPYEEVRLGIAKIILNLVVEKQHQVVLLREPIVSILILILQQHQQYNTFETTIFALSSLSQIPSFQPTMIANVAIDALMHMIFSGKVTNTKLCQEICRTWTHLSYVTAQAEPILQSQHLALAMGILHQSRLSIVKDTQLLMLLMIRNFATENIIAKKYLVEQDVFQLVVQMIAQDFEDIQQHHDYQEAQQQQQQQQQQLTGGSIDLEGGSLADDQSLSVDSLHVESIHRIRSVGYVATIQLVHSLCQVPSLHNALIQQQVMMLLQRICIPKDAPDIASTAAMSSLVEEEESSELSVMAGMHGGQDLFRDLPINQLIQGSGNSSGSKLVANSTPNKRMQSFTVNNNNAPPAEEPAKAVQFDLNPSPNKANPASKATQPPLDYYHYSYKHRIYITSNEVELIAKSLQLLSQTPSCHEAMVAGGVMILLRALIYANMTEQSRFEMSSTLAQIAQSKSCRETLVHEGACELLIALSITSDHQTQAQATTALAYLSEITRVKKGVVASLLLLSLNLEGGNVLVNPHADTNKPHVQHESHSEHNLNNLLKDLMIDKKRFDGYLDALRKNNHENMSHNAFVPKSASPSRVNSSAQPARPKSSFMVDVANGAVTNSNTATNASAGSGLSNRKASNVNAANAHDIAAPTMRRSFDNSSEVSTVASNFAYFTTNMNKTSSLFTNLVVSLSHKMLLQDEEDSALRSRFESFLYIAPTSTETYQPQPGGLSKKLLVELPLPSIPSDRELEPPNRHDELLKIPVNQDPLPKDLQAPKYLDHHRSITTGDNNSSVLNTGSRLDEPSIQSTIPSGRRTGSQQGKRESSADSRDDMSPGASGSRMNQLRKLGNKKQDAKAGLDSRSPLMKSERTPIFRSTSGTVKESALGKNTVALPKISRGKSSSSPSRMDDEK